MPLFPQSHPAVSSCSSASFAETLLYHFSMESEVCSHSAREAHRERRALHRRPLLRRLLAFALVVLWSGLVLYPNPAPLVKSFQRSFNPPIDPAAVSGIAAALPDDPAAVEAFSESFLTYRTAWELYGQFWYFPSVQEVVGHRAGDCQAEDLLTASILAAKGIPFTLRYSLTHAWVDYEGKGINELEDPALAVVSDAGAGWLGSLPSKWPLRETLDQLTAYHWTPMPWPRKVLLGMGLLAGIVLGE